MSREDDRCCFCRSAGWEIFKEGFFPSVRKRPRYRKFPQVKVLGKDWSIAGKLRQWVLSVWQERSFESQSWPVWSRGLGCMWLIWSRQLSYQCERATVDPSQCPQLIGTRQDLAPGDSENMSWRKSTLKDCEK